MCRSLLVPLRRLTRLAGTYRVCAASYETAAGVTTRAAPTWWWNTWRALVALSPFLSYARPEIFKMLLTSFRS
jgi:hypothetical protein